MKNDSLKKNHFWILLGLIPLLVLIAIVMITSGVGAAIDERQAAIEAAKSELSSKSNPKSGGLLINLDKQIEKLKVKRTDLWKENWERSIGVSVREEEGKDDLLAQDQSRNLLRWPNSEKLARFNYTTEYATNPNQLKFGADIVRQEDDLGEYNEFRKEEVYLREFSSPFKTGMADKVAPTTFRGGRWETVLRHVMMPANGPNGWGETRPTSEQLWLALEDIWIQRAMLGQITAVNKQIAEFARIPRVGMDGQALPDSKLERDFQSRIWRISLKAAPRESDGKFILTGTLTNVTDRLQLMGVNNTMILNVWFSNEANAQPFQFRIGGEFVAGRGSGRETLKIPISDEHVVKDGTIPTEIARVEQAFDARTVPIRRIDRLVLGYVDSRWAQVELKLPNFKKYQDAAATEVVPAVDPMGMPGGAPPPGGFPGAPGGQPAIVQEGGGTAEAVLDGNKRRYLVVTNQVRRMPVAITVVVDQSYIQDVLLAYANAPLRFQITQVHWQRFRGSLTGVTGYGSGTEPGTEMDQPQISGQGFEGTGFGATGFGPGGIGLRPPGPGGFPMGPPAPGFPGAAMPPGSPAMPPGGIGPESPYGPFGPGGTMTTVTDSQLTSGLVEMTVYGLVSLYEKYDPATAGTGEGQTPP